MEPVHPNENWTGIYNDYKGYNNNNNNNNQGHQANPNPQGHTTQINSNNHDSLNDQHHTHNNPIPNTTPAPHKPDPVSPPSNLLPESSIPSNKLPTTPPSPASTIPFPPFDTHATPLPTETTPPSHPHQTTGANSATLPKAAAQTPTPRRKMNAPNPLAAPFIVRSSTAAPPTADMSRISADVSRISADVSEFSAAGFGANGGERSDKDIFQVISSRSVGARARLNAGIGTASGALERRQVRIGERRDGIMGEFEEAYGWEVRNEGEARRLFEAGVSCLQRALVFDDGGNNDNNDKKKKHWDDKAGEEAVLFMKRSLHYQAEARKCRALVEKCRDELEKCHWESLQGLEQWYGEWKKETTKALEQAVSSEMDKKEAEVKNLTRDAKAKSMDGDDKPDAGIRGMETGGRKKNINNAKNKKYKKNPKPVEKIKKIEKHEDHVVDKAKKVERHEDHMEVRK